MSGTLDDLLGELDAINRGDFMCPSKSAHALLASDDECKKDPGGRRRPQCITPAPSKSLHDGGGASSFNNLMAELTALTAGGSNTKTGSAVGATLEAGAAAEPPARLPGRVKSFSAMKCAAVHIGGTQHAMGRSFAQNGPCVLCCDSLACTKCDCRVLSFDDRQWAADVDYIFFRNRFPEEEKLASKLEANVGVRAYCCQCTWISAERASVLDCVSMQLRWVCRGHLQ